ncbi:MAG: hypothetical protein GEU80_04375 [Dehalococcoidia bacterium]|nr:hypothetical protein [Dehalococcoidia bacterium]
MSTEPPAGLAAGEDEPSAPPLAAVAFATGACATLVGVLVGGALGWVAAQGDGDRDVSESVMLGAMFIGLLFAPATMAPVRLARVWPHDWSGSPAGILGRGTAGSALAGVVWGGVGSLLVFALGSLANLPGVEFVFTNILLLGAGFGLVAGTLLGGLVTGVRLLRHRGDREPSGAARATD